MNILITNHHSKENKGDLAILLGLVSSLKKENKDIKFSIIGRYIEERAWWEKRGINFFVPILSVPKNSRWRAIKFVIHYHISLILLNWRAVASMFYSAEKMKTLKVYEDMDIVISKGGSFFREPEYKINFFPIGIMGHLHQLILAQKFKKPVILSAQSFGPINNPYSRYITGKVFKKCSLVTTRDTESEAFLRQKLNISRNIFATGDSAFLLEEPEGRIDPALMKSIQTNKQKGYKCVGVTVRFWSNQKQSESYIDSISHLLSTYSKDNFFFYLMPQVVGPYKEDDRRASNIIWNNLADSVKDKVLVIEDELEVGELLNLYGQMDYFVATRLHSAIFSILGGTPVMAIGYEPKTLSIFTDLELTDYVLDIRTISPEKIQTSFEVLLNTPKELFSKAREKAVASARKNIELISNIINGNGIEHSQARRFLDTTRGYTHSYERNRRIEDWATKERVALKIIKDF